MATPDPMYLALRERILTLNPADVGLLPDEDRPRPWAVLMETGWPEGAVTLVGVADGATSLYFSNGGGILGAGETPAVAEVTRRYVADAAAFLPEMTPTEAFPLPELGQVRFYVMTHDGAYTAAAAEDALRRNDDPLAPLYAMAQEVITQVRLYHESRSQ
jgi:hypothetical protein